MQQPGSTILAFDIGSKRIGVARASVVVRIAAPLQTILHTETIMQDIPNLLKEHDAAAIVVGLPRGLDGQSTGQTKMVEDFVEDLKTYISVPVYWQDEALTSHKAEEELESRGKPYAKGDVDALAATYILEDFLQEHVEIE